MIDANGSTHGPSSDTTKNDPPVAVPRSTGTSPTDEEAVRATHGDAPRRDR